MPSAYGLDDYLRDNLQRNVALISAAIGAILCAFIEAALIVIISLTNETGVTHEDWVLAIVLFSSAVQTATISIIQILFGKGGMKNGANGSGSRPSS